ncbi:Ankyrin repeat protein [Lasiodiplodia theobromae]|uniref:Ankyrin repeat protein n=1 Tax=Lasiodiplodia theobromae TaxID=45133 RepID=UPI0015C39B17|nr:Ankyrin repeat protein [Lasiodiplodia theobromae]KAF4535903.1 Ankyrin repeat protein [Lasiodiplodia theobromae]
MNNPLETNFGKVLGSFKAKLTQDEYEDFCFATLDDLKQTVVEIQAEQGSARRLQNLRRLDAFLEAMEQYDKVVQIFLNAADLLAFIWGPAKFILITASTWNESFNTLLDAYEEIGNHIPLLKQYEGIIKRSPELHIVLELIYKDILNFHQRAIKHFRTKVWKQLFHATWKTFRTDFQAILKSLQSHKRLLDSQGILIGAQEIQKVREQIENGIQESQIIREQIENERQQRQKDEETRRRREVSTWLAAADSIEDQETATEARSKYPTSGVWMVRERLVTRWCDLHSQSEPCLWINGKPGAGKTVLASVLVEKCNSIAHANVAYFYCRAEDCSRNTFIGVCRSLISQLVQQNTSILSYAYEKSSLSGHSQLDSTILAKEMLAVALNAFENLFIIIDGIDECKKDEKKRISEALISMAESRMFQKLPTFRITENHTKGDVLDYCIARENTIAQYFQISATEIQQLNISHKVAAKADGMFLFAKLVMENLLQQCTRAGLKAEIGRIPPDLDKAYNRLLIRILQDSPKPEQQIAKRLLCWLLCTQRPLKWHEIQGAMAIDIENLTFDYQERSLIKDSKAFCGSLVEVRKGGTIELVHQTARNFLKRQDELQLDSEEVDFACICLGTLTLSSHDDGLSEDSIRDYILKGYYGFSDYSVVSWQDPNPNLNASLNFDNSPLGMAIRCRDVEIFEALLSRAPDDLFQGIDETNVLLESFKYLFFAQTMKNGNDEIVTTYLMKLKKIDTFLFASAMRLQPDWNKLVLFLNHAANGGDTAFKDNGISYLKVAVEHLHEETSRYLLYDLGLWEKLQDRLNRSFLATAAFNGHEGFLRRILLTENADTLINTWVRTLALHRACDEGSSNKVETLLNDEQVDPNMPGVFGYTPTAIELSNEELYLFPDSQKRLEYYLLANTNWDLYPIDSTMLIRFCATGNLRQVQNAIRKAPHDLNVPDSRGWTPFLHAVKSRRNEIAEFLLEKGCDSQTFEGSDRVSPLMIAVEQDDLAMVRLLLSEARVDPTYKNGKGKAAIDYLDPNSPVAEQIRDEIKDATDMASVFGNFDS